MRAKANGDKEKANALKLVCNTTYGATLNQYNALYDPLMARSVCISGQLYLLELANHMHHTIPNLRICQCNTDGLMVQFDDSYYPQVKSLTEEWQQRTGFLLEEDEIVQLVQKDVNGYIEVQKNGAVKVKGGYLVKGVLTNGKLDFVKMGYPNWNNLSGGAFKINNDAVIVAKALQDYFVKGTPVEETINSATEIREFQLIAKASSKYSECYQIVDGETVPAQRVNRVYAVTDTRKGNLYKIHATTGSHAKIAGLPKHCAIDNNNELDISVVDRKWYIRLAQKYINDFLGIKPLKKNTRKINSLKKQSLSLFD